MYALDAPTEAALGLRLDHARRELAYSPSSAIGGNYAPYIRAYADQSAAAHAALPQRQTLAYGDAERQNLDFFPSPQRQREDRPGLLVFIHGGYWQELSKNESAFLAPAWHAAGFAHAVLGYTLAPQAKIGMIITECVMALTYLQKHAQSLGFDKDGIVVCGSSAGGFLAAVCAAMLDFQLRGVVPVSGIFDLRPLVGTSINQALQMDQVEAIALSDMALADHPVPRVVPWGEHETSAFKQQSLLFHARAKAYARPSEAFEIAGRNHFDVVHELGIPGSRLFEATHALFA